MKPPPTHTWRARPMCLAPCMHAGGAQTLAWGASLTSPLFEPLMYLDVVWTGSIRHAINSGTGFLIVVLICVGCTGVGALLSKLRGNGAGKRAGGGVAHQRLVSTELPRARAAAVGGGARADRGDGPLMSPKRATHGDRRTSRDRDGDRRASRDRDGGGGKSIPRRPKGGRRVPGRDSVDEEMAPIRGS